MPLDEFDIGDTITFTYEPKDEDGEATSPASVSLTINFVGEDGRQDIAAPIAMTPPAAPGDPWTATWNTKGIGAKTGPVDWCITAIGPDDVMQRSFLLTANRANTN